MRSQSCCPPQTPPNSHMSIIQFDPQATDADPSGGLSVHRRLCAGEPHSVLAVDAARLAGDAATLWCVYFFRDPPRVTPVRDGIVVAPADGRVSQIVNAVPPAELGLGERPLPRISIFMSVFDCHVNRSPVAGRIETDRLSRRQIPVRRSRQSERGQRTQRFRHRRRDGPAHRVVQIAGLVARRIVPFAREGETVGAGQRIGMIRFGSRVDVYLPEGTRRAGRRRPDRHRRRDRARRSQGDRGGAHVSGGLRGR